MKIKVVKRDYERIMALPVKQRKKPLKPSVILATIIRIISAFSLFPLKFTFNKKRMERLSKKEPALILMNHSSFIDLKIASRLLYPRRYNIVMTSDGFVGKELLMRMVGCIPTQKFVSDSVLVRDIFHCIKKNKTSVLMYPEAGYSFDGTATVLPESLGKLIKKLAVPVVMIKTYGAFAYDPLYNNLQTRKTKVSADMEYILSPDDIKDKSFEEINEILNEHFSFDNFLWQQQNNIKITESFRADCLNRVLYKCPNCKQEGKTVGKGVYLKCENCGKVYELTENGFMKAVEGVTEFPHIPDWYNWQRQCVKNEIKNGEYKLDIDVDIYMLVNTKCVYDIGSGRLTHNYDGFHLTGCDGKLDYTQSSLLSYSLNSDYYWYEIGDIISIGNSKALYYCLPKIQTDIVAKTRIATEEIYKLRKKEKSQ